jgi:prepilin-type N-terminal cleavage/methylation domain-containing protein
MKRAGFTMIELIFVIVILGILAAVAIPKLAATRSDAEASKMVSNLATCIGDGGSAYLKDGNFSTIHANGAWAATSLTGLAASTHSVACEDALACFALTSNDANGTLQVANGSDVTSAKCVQAQALALKNKLIRINQF